MNLLKYKEAQLMALLKDTTVSGSLRATDSIFTTELQT